jgi:hypothetical protein
MLPALAGLAALAFAASSAPGSKPPTAFARTVSSAPLKVTSTLDGKTVLPIRIQWIARPNVSPPKVEAVDYLIDGRLAWVEHHSPYFYADDGNWLVTTFLKPGKHVFTVRVITTTGRTSTDATTARVVAAPAPPTQLLGTWGRTVTAADVKKATSNSPPPPGRWEIRIGAEGWALGTGHAPTANSLSFDVAYLANGHLQMRPTIERLPYQGDQGGFCNGVDPLFTWTVSVDATSKTMTLNPSGRDPCGDRVAILQGTWTRVG